MNKKLIRLTESDLHRIVKESVKKILKEWNKIENPDYDPREIIPFEHPVIQMWEKGYPPEVIFDKLKDEEGYDSIDDVLDIIDKFDDSDFSEDYFREFNENELGYEYD